MTVTSTGGAIGASLLNEGAAHGRDRSMFDRILDLLRPGDAPRAETEIHIAVAALLVEAARMDDDFDAAERATIRLVLAKRFALDAQSVDRLIRSAETAAD